MAGSKNSGAQFTYDFGIAIAQSTVNKITRLTGATFTLASAFYALKSAASEYVNTLRESTIRFGGALSTIKAMEQAQDRLIKGQSYFNVDDQLKGMNQLMAVGVDVGENLNWINKAAHAAGKSYAEFSGIIASAIQGNSQALVDAGLMTQRATRMFDKYAANTVMRQQAILNFVKNHKGLMNAIKNDFETVQDQIIRIKSTWNSFLKSVIGKPNDSQSFYGQIVSSMKMVATALSQNMEQIKRYGFIIGQTLGWVIKQIGHFVVWVGRQVKKTLGSVWSVTDDFQNQARSLLVWLEFWKLKIVGFFKEYGDEIKTILKLLIAYKVLKHTFIISEAAILSVIKFRKEWAGLIALMKIRNFGKLGGLGRLMSFRLLRKSNNRQILRFFGFDNPTKIINAFIDLGIKISNGLHAVFSRGTLVAIGKLIRGIFSIKSLKLFFGFLRNIPGIFMAVARAGKALISVLMSSNPIGWIVLAIGFLTTLYMKSEKFRKLVNKSFKVIWEYLKLLWNSLMYVFTWIMIGCKKIWDGVKWLGGKFTGFLSWIWDGVKGLFTKMCNKAKEFWNAFMDTRIGRWINDNIVKPIRGVFEWIIDAWNKLIKGLGAGLDYILDALGFANDNVSQATEDLAKKYGVPVLPTVEGGKYDTNDSTNYLTKMFGGGSDISSKSEPVSTGNPMLSDAGSTGGFSGGGGGNSTSMTFNNGAIQIVVQKGDGINERVLAQKVRNVLNDMKREGNMRGGML